MRTGSCLSVSLVFVLVFAGAAWADDYIGPTGGNYDVAASWSGGTVPSGTSAYIRNGSTVTLDSSVAGVYELLLGHPTDPSAANGSALYVLNGASLTANATVQVGGSFSASAVQSGGVISASGFNVASSGGATGQYTLSGGTLTTHYSTAPGGTGSTMNIGAAGGTGTFLQTGGYVSLINDTYLNVGNGTGSTGAASYGQFTMTNGSIYVGTQQLNVGSSGGRGTFTMSDGKVETLYKFQVGYRGQGVFNQNGGTVQHSPTEALTLGHCDPSAPGPARGVYNLSSGLLEVRGARGPRIGSYASPTYGQGVGIMNVSGGLLVVDPVTNAGVLSVGYKSGEGTLNVSGGSVYSKKILVADQVQDVTWPPTDGYVNVSGGVVEATSEFTIGRDGYGRLNITGGSVVAGTASPTVCLRAGENDSTYATEGVINVSGGSLTALTSIDVGLQTGKGTLNISGTGVVYVGNKTIIGNSAIAPLGTGGRGMMTMTGGSFGSPGSVYVGYRGSVAPGVDAELNILGGKFRADQIRMLSEDKPGVANKAVLRVSPTADVQLANLLQIEDTGASVVMEIASATSNSRIDAANGMLLGSGLATLDVNSTGYRPKEGDTAIILASPLGIAGDFSSIGSNITNGLQGALPAFAGAVVTDPNTSAGTYVVTFQGLTAGDANGDHKVDGGDLALMGGAWMQSGKAWGAGNFNADPNGMVDGGDLALMGGNWMWTLPSPGPGSAPLPEPATLALLSLGGMAMIRRRKR